MLILNLDPSVLTGKSNTEKCVLTVNVAGIAWGADSASLRSFDFVDDMMDYFYPFRWRRPELIKVLWLDATYNYVGCNDFKIEANTFDDADRIVVQGHYESILNNKIVESASETPILINHKEVIREVVSASPRREIDYYVTGDGDPSVPPPPAREATDFLASSIAQFAQKLVPNNLGLKLAFIAKGSAPPANASYCVAIPIGPADSDTNWVRNAYIHDGTTEHECATLPSTAAPPSFEIDPGNFYVNYKNSDNTNLLLRTYSEITQLPVSTNPNPAIRLRDKYGNFIGHSLIQVSDSEQLLNGRELKERIIQATSPIFNLPMLVWAFLSDNADRIKTYYEGAASPLEKEAVHANLNQLFISLLRDGYCVGNKFVQESAQPILEGIVEQYHARIQGLANHKKLEADEVVKGFSDRDRTISLREWRAILDSEAVLQTKLKELDDSKPYVAEYDVRKWLDLCKEIVAGHPFVSEKDDEFQQAKRRILQHHITSGIIAGHFGANDDISKNSRAVLSEVAQTYFEHFDPGTEFVRSIACAIGANTGTSQFQSTERDKVQTTLRSCLVELVTLRSSTHVPGNENYVFPSVSEEVGVIDSCLSPFWNSVIEFVRNFDFNAGGPIAFDLDSAIETVLLTVADQKMADVPPNLAIRVDDIESGDDLSNEISGHLLFIQRAKKMHTEDFDAVPWRALNLSCINLIDKTTTVGNKWKTIPLKGKYLVPSFLPSVSDDLRTGFLSLSNDPLSLTAANEIFSDLEKDAEDDSPFQAKYLFNNGLGEVPAAYSLWYGFNYRFANFLALNSGVLAGAVADPNLVTLRINDAVIEEAPQTPYRHLRRVPFSKVHAEVFRERKQRVYPVPIGLNTIASEMLEHGDQVAEGSNELPVYLLFDEKTGIRQGTMRIELGKPHTDFWNWYAWMGEDLSNDEGTKKEFEEVYKLYLATLKDSKVSNPYLHDPALENELRIEVTEIFPDQRSVGELTVRLTESKEGKKVIRKIENGSIQVELSTVHDAIYLDAVNNIIYAPPGVTLKISVRCLTKKEYFEKGRKNRFHHWMKNEMGLTEFVSPDPKLYGTRPLEIVFETAIEPKGLLKSYDGWEALIPFETDRGEVALDLLPKDWKFAYFSRTAIDHQVWHWNGRLTADLLKEAEEPERLQFPQSLDPVEGGKTNFAMNWEAWEFSDRPDSSALRHETNLKARRGGGSQTVFTDSRPVDEKARYYRFSTEMFGRYELLGGVYAGSVKSAISIRDPDKGAANQWKRFFRPSRRVDELPKPVIRFVIPLTESIEECHASDESRSASLMIVLNDRWFSETGLAETCEVGIEILKDDAGAFLNAGPDPILSGKGLDKVDMDAKARDFYIEPGQAIDANPLIKTNPLAVFRPEGPAGLTFDLAASTPKLIATTFILKANDINQLLGAHEDAKTEMGMSAWSMAQIAVRRNIERSFWENADFSQSVREFHLLPEDKVGAEKKRLSELYFAGEDDQSKFEEQLQTLWDLSQAEDEAGYEGYQTALKVIRTLYKASNLARKVEDGKLAEIKSKWSAKEWVQFLPDTASLIPQAWRCEHTQKGAVSFTLRHDDTKRVFLDAAGKIEFPKFSPSDDTFVESAQRYLVISETTTNAGGQPVERYRGTFKHHEDKSLILNDSVVKDEKFKGFAEGYARLLLVRTRADRADNGNLWEMLFGANKDRSAGFTDVQSDPQAALPLISKRFPIKVT